MGFQISEGPQARPQRLLVYGPEGIGKSTLASKMPDPVFVDVEDGTSHMYVRRLEQPHDWQTLLAEVDFLCRNPSGAATVVVDTADAAEALCQAYVCSKAGKSSIESWSYGKGYVFAREEYQHLLDALDRCVTYGLNVVLVAHSTMRKFERPDESGAYDRFELKLNKHVSALVKEWADAVLFCDWETFVSVDDNGKAKASGGKRVIRTDHAPQWDAKNRWGLPPKIPLDEDGIAQVRSHLTPGTNGPAPKAEPKPAPMPEPKAAEPEPPAEMPKAPLQMGPDELKEEAKRRKELPKRFSKLLDLMAKDNVSIAELEAVMAAKGKREPGQPLSSWEQGFVEWTCGQWDAVMGILREQRELRAAAADADTPF